MNDLISCWQTLVTSTASLSRNLPSMGSNLCKRISLWTPRKMFWFDFKCLRLRSYLLPLKRIYHRVRSVIDISMIYYSLASKFLECSPVNELLFFKIIILWRQLIDDSEAQFRFVLTRGFSCDKTIISLMREKSSSNSKTACFLYLWATIKKEWEAQSHIFYSHKYKKAVESSVSCVWGKSCVWGATNF